MTIRCRPCSEAGRERRATSTHQGIDCCAWCLTSFLSSSREPFVTVDSGFSSSLDTFESVGSAAARVLERPPKATEAHR